MAKIRQIINTLISSQKMDQYIQSSVVNFRNDLIDKCEVYNSLRSCVDIVEHYAQINHLLKTQETLRVTEKFNQELIKRIRSLEEVKGSNEKELDRIKSSAKIIRDRFAADVFYFLSENRTNQRLKDRVKELENALQQAEAMIEAQEEQKQLAIPNKPLETAQSTPTAVVIPKDPRFPKLALDLDPEILLKYVIPFLSTVDVLQYAQICRYAYKLIDGIFGINSEIIKPEWGIRSAVITGDSISHSHSSRSSSFSTIVTKEGHKSVNAVSASSNSVSEAKNMAQLTEPMLKKLTVNEQKLILGLTEKVKKYGQNIETLTSEKEELGAKLKEAEHVQELLINKLREAERWIKDAMDRRAEELRQVASDNEVITYLDLRVSNLEGQLTNAEGRAGQLQAALDLQIGTHSYREEQLSSELNDWKLKHEKLDAAFKQQKKLLVKEVKQLRAQVESLTIERNTMSTRLGLLRQALDPTAVH